MLGPEKIDNQNKPVATQQPPARLYPDLPRQPLGAMAPQPFDPVYFPPNQSPTPFVPFGPQTAPNRGLNDLQFRLRPRPVTSVESQQSESFMNGLGKRLLSLVGMNATSGGNESTTSGSGSLQELPRARFDDTIRALQNMTVLDQLNRGVHTIYDSLSKMYNSTVQKQLDLLQERFRNETADSPDLRQQRMAQQVPQFFKMLALKVEEAQGNMNRLWQQFTQASNGSLNMGRAISRQSMSPEQEFVGSISRDAQNAYQPESFFGQIGRSLGFDDQPVVRQRSNDFISQFTDFWNDQVQPELKVLQNQVSRTWRDLTSSGAFTPAQNMMSRQGAQNVRPLQNSENRSADLIDDILKSVDMSGPEYTLVEPKGEQEGGVQRQQVGIGSQFQNRMIAMQREINQLWAGLTSSLQGALSNVRRTLNPRQSYEPLARGQSSDPTENEIDSRINDITKLQQEADVVHSVVRQQQERAQQRPSLGERFRNLFNIDTMGTAIDQFPNRIGESVSRLGTVVGDIWNQIPDRWDNFMHNMRPQQPSARYTTPSTTTIGSTVTMKPESSGAGTT